MKSTGRNFMVGLVSIVALLSFATLLMLFGELEELTTSRYQITIRMNNAGGLRQGSVVELNGVPVGRIDRVDLNVTHEYPDHPVRVIAKIEQDVRIAENVKGVVESQLIAGAASMQLKTVAPEVGETVAELPHDGTAVIYLEYTPLLELIASELDARTEPLVRAIDAFEELSQTYIEVGRNLNALIEPQDAQAIAAGEPPNLHAAVFRFHELIDETETSLRLAQNWLGDEQLRGELRDAVVNARQLIEDAAATLTQVGMFTTQLEDRADDLVNRLVPIADELAVIFEQMRILTASATEGEGTIAQLLNNPDLYNNLNDATMRLERALREVQLFIQKVAAEGLPVRWF